MTTIPEHAPARLPRLGGPEDGERRWNLLALLLTDIGLSLALSMACLDDVREAVEHRFGSLYP